jgi:hypothetical protein
LPSMLALILSTLLGLIATATWGLLSGLLLREPNPLALPALASAVASAVLTVHLVQGSKPVAVGRERVRRRRLGRSPV